MKNRIVLLLVIFVLFFGSTYASSVSRSFSAATVEVGSEVTVTLTVNIDGGETYYAIDETIPAGWTVIYADNEPDSTQQTGHIKWVVIENAASTTYTYTVTAPGTAETATFSGVYMFEEMASETQIAGENQVTVTSASCTIDGDCSGQICCSELCTSPACTTGSCGTGFICSSPGICTAECQAITECIDDDGYCPVGCDSTTDNDCSETCGNDQVDAGENCANCPADISCDGGTLCCETECIVPACSSDSDCDDGDDCTTDTCSSAGTCIAACTNTAIADCGGGSTIGSGPSGPGGGTSGAKLIVNIQGSCVWQPITVKVLNEQGNPSKDAEVMVIKDRKTVETAKTGETGKISFTFEETGDYEFYITKSNHKAYSEGIQVLECASMQVQFEQEIKTGEKQIIMLLVGDGSPVEDFNLLLVYPDSTTELLFAKDGAVKIEVEHPGKYTAIVQSTGYKTSLSFEATTPHQIVPNINPDAEPVVETVFGKETIQQPNYLIIWILAIAIISGLIIEVTKLKPGWFRVFLAITYTALPLVVNYYTKNIFIAFIVIIMQTIILTALYFNQWRIKKALHAMTEFENR